MHDTRTIPFGNLISCQSDTFIRSVVWHKQLCYSTVEFLVRQIVLIGGDCWLGDFFVNAISQDLQKSRISNCACGKHLVGCHVNAYQLFKLNF